MKLKENIRLKQIGDECILVSNDGSNLNYTRVISLNSTAEFLIQESFDNEFTKTDWVDRLVEKYGIDKLRAEADVEALIEKLTQARVIYE